jgi:hypothetical protein
MLSRFPDTGKARQGASNVWSDDLILRVAYALVWQIFLFFFFTKRQLTCLYDRNLRNTTHNCRFNKIFRLRFRIGIDFQKVRGTNKSSNTKGTHVPNHSLQYHTILHSVTSSWYTLTVYINRWFSIITPTVETVVIATIIISLFTSHD